MKIFKRKKKCGWCKGTGIFVSTPGTLPRPATIKCPLCKGKGWIR